MTYPDSA